MLAPAEMLHLYLSGSTKKVKFHENVDIFDWEKESLYMTLVKNMLYYNYLVNDTPGGP